MSWIEAQELWTDARRFVPRDLVNLDFTGQRTSVVISSSNGLASGNTISEAILHGLCELIERDQLSFWLVRQKLHSNPPATRVRLSSIAHKTCTQLLAQCANGGLTAVVWYTSVNLDIPTFSCTVFDRTSGLFAQRASGHGCHPDKGIALSRAVTEALQSRLTHIAGSRDDLYWTRYLHDIPMTSRENLDWVETIDCEREEVDYSSIRTSDDVATTFRAIEVLGSALRSQGMDQVFYVDLTEKHLKVPVVFVVVPGLEFNAKKPLYAPGPRMSRYLAELGFK